MKRPHAWRLEEQLNLNGLYFHQMTRVGRFLPGGLFRRKKPGKNRVSSGCPKQVLDVQNCPKPVRNLKMGLKLYIFLLSDVISFPCDAILYLEQVRNIQNRLGELQCSFNCLKQVFQVLDVQNCPKLSKTVRYCPKLSSTEHNFLKHSTDIFLRVIFGYHYLQGIRFLVQTGFGRPKLSET